MSETEKPKEPPKKIEKFEDLWVMYLEWLPKTMDERGIFPLPAFMVAKDDGLEIAAICGSELVHPFAIKAIAEKEAKMLIFGLDRNTKPNQGTEFADCFTVFGWDGKTWIMGVVNYQNEPRIVRDIDMKNTFWNGIMARELRATGLVQLTESAIRV